MRKKLVYYGLFYSIHRLYTFRVRMIDMPNTNKFQVSINGLLPYEKLGPQGAAEWRRILVESTDKGDDRRAEYARWMLRDILLDPQYEDPRS